MSAKRRTCVRLWVFVVLLTGMTLSGPGSVTAARAKTLDLDKLQEQNPWQAARRVVVQMLEGEPDQREHATAVMADLIAIHASQLNHGSDHGEFLQYAADRLADALTSQKISVRTDVEAMLRKVVDELHEPLAFGSESQRGQAEALITSVVHSMSGLESGHPAATSRAARRVYDHGVATLGHEPGPRDLLRGATSTAGVKLSARPDTQDYDPPEQTFAPSDEVVLRLLADQLHQPAPATRHAALTLTLRVAPKIRLGLRDGGTSGRAQAERVMAGVRENLGDDDTSLRLLATRAAGMCKDLTAAPQLIELLEDEDAAIRTEAATALCSVSGHDYGNSIDQWRAWLRR